MCETSSHSDGKQPFPVGPGLSRGRIGRDRGGMKLKAAGRNPPALKSSNMEEKTGESLSPPGSGASAALPHPEEQSPQVGAINVDLFCPDCGYNLRGLTSDRCPECGRDILILRERRVQIPWSYRDKNGLFRSYWKTVWFVMSQGKKFSLEVNRPVGLGEARRFRLLTLLHAYLPILALSVAGMLWRRTPTSEEWGYFAVVQGALAVYLLAFTTLPYYAIRHPDVPLLLQHRAAILTLYACAPLAWMFLPVLCTVMGAVCTAARQPTMELFFYLLGAFSGIILPLTAMSETISLL